MASTSAGSKTITGYLKRVIGSPVGEIIPLTNKDISIGRTKDSDIRVKDPNISRNHCSLHYSSDEWFITDLGGINGTFLDNIKLIPRDPIALKDGMGIYLGPPSDSPVAFVFIKNKEDLKLLQRSLCRDRAVKEEMLDSSDNSIEMTQFMSPRENKCSNRAQCWQRKRRAEDLSDAPRKVRKISDDDVVTLTCNSVESLDEYDMFARHIASQMRQLPIKDFVLLQEKIQSLITKERFKNIAPKNSLQKQKKKTR